MNDLKPFKHGDEGTHHACQEKIKKYGGKSTCCECTGCEFCKPTTQREYTVTFIGKRYEQLERLSKKSGSKLNVITKALGLLEKAKNV